MAKTFKNPNRMELIKTLEDTARKENSNVWAAVAGELSRSRSNRREVNIFKINKNTSKGDVVIVPGKVLGSGVLDHEIKIAALRFTDGAQKKIKAAGGSMLDIIGLLRENPKGLNVKLIG